MIHFLGNFAPSWHSERYIADALEWWGRDVCCYELAHDWDRPGDSDNPPISPGDIVLTSAPQRFCGTRPKIGTPSMLDRWRQQGARLISWHFDWVRDYVNPHGEKREDVYLKTLPKFDLALSTDGTDGGWYAHHGVNRMWLPQAAPPDDMPVEAGQTTPLLFVGSCYTEARRERLHRLAHHGLTWANGAADARLWGSEFSRLVNSAGIVIGDNYRNDIPGYWSDRVYRVLACGGFLLTPAVLGLEEWFEDGKHLITYEDDDDLADKISYWTRQPAKRKRIAQAGCKLVHDKHTYTHRVRELLDIMGGMRRVAVEPKDMRLGLVGYTNETSGLGLVNHDLYRALDIDSVLSVWSVKGQEVWGDRQMTACNQGPNLTYNDMVSYLGDYAPHALLMVETPHNTKLLDLCRERGIKTALIVMHEVYNAHQWPIDLYICPNRHCYDLVTEKNKVLFPLPLDIAPFEFKQRRGKPKTWLHVVGYGCTNGKRQTDKVIDGFLESGVEGKLIVHTQRDISKAYGYSAEGSPDPRVVFRSSLPNPADVYAGADVCIQPEMYAGYGRSMYEASACGIPVLTTDAPPMNEIVTDKDWLIPVDSADMLRTPGGFNAVRYRVTAGGVAEAISRVARRSLARKSKQVRRVAESHAWTDAKAHELTELLEELL